MSEEKALLREQARKHRALNDTRDEDIEAATAFFFDTIQPNKNQIIGAYWPKGREFDPTHILDQALKQGIKCALPKVENNSRILKFMSWSQDEPLTKGTFDIMEPENGVELEPDILIVPMLAFDRKGYRLGQGGGYYDATLQHFRAKKDIQAVGVAYSSQAVLFNLPAEAHDQKMDWILTPQGMTSFKD